MGVFRLAQMTTAIAVGSVAWPALAQSRASFPDAHASRASEARGSSGSSSPRATGGYSRSTGGSSYQGGAAPARASGMSMGLTSHASGGRVGGHSSGSSSWQHAQPAPGVPSLLGSRQTYTLSGPAYLPYREGRPLPAGYDVEGKRAERAPWRWVG